MQNRRDRKQDWCWPYRGSHPGCGRRTEAGRYYASIKSVSFFTFHGLLPTANKHTRWEDLAEKPAEGQWTYFGRNP